MDTWRETRVRRLEVAAARRLERRIVGDARKVLFISPALQAHFRERYPGIETACIPHCVPAGIASRAGGPARTALPAGPRPTENRDELLIVYTGQVYETSADPILTLFAALPLLADLNPRIVVSTPDPPHRLARFGVTPGPRVEIVNLPDAEAVQRLQVAADLLYNPVTFLATHTPQVRTLFPTKTLEYLAADRPMLVHGPASASFVAYARGRGFATVADAPDPQSLAGAIRKALAEGDGPSVRAARRVELRERRADRVAAAFLDAVAGALPAQPHGGTSPDTSGPASP